jgi:hypothetical protein
MPDLFSALQNIVKEVEASPGAMEDIVKGTGSVAAKMVNSALEGTVYGLDAADTAAVEVLGQSLTRIIGASEAIGVLGANMLAERMFTYSETAAKRLPGPFAKMARVFTSAKVHNGVLRDRILQYLASVGPSMLKDHATVATMAPHWASKAAMLAGPVTGVTGTPVLKVGTVLVKQSDITRLQKEINTLAYSLGIQQHSGTVPQQVWNQIQTNQRAIAALTTRVDAIDTRLGETAGNTASVQRQVSALASAISGIRTVNEGWQDIVDELRKHVTTLTQTYNHAEGQIHAQGHQIQQLAPLAVLLAAGPLGMKVLKQLQKTPCMCPKPKTFGNVPNELGTALAVELVVAHGF